MYIEKQMTNSGRPARRAPAVIRRVGGVGRRPGRGRLSKPGWETPGADRRFPRRRRRPRDPGPGRSDRSRLNGQGGASEEAGRPPVSPRRSSGRLGRPRRGGGSPGNPSGRETALSGGCGRSGADRAGRPLSGSRRTLREGAFQLRERGGKRTKAAALLRG